KPEEHGPLLRRGDERHEHPLRTLRACPRSPPHRRGDGAAAHQRRTRPDRAPAGRTGMMFPGLAVLIFIALLVLIVVAEDRREEKRHQAEIEEKRELLRKAARKWS